MTRKFGGYSPNHDRSLKNDVKKARKVKASQITSPLEIPTTFDLTSEQRSELRAKQLLSQGIRIASDPDLTVQDPRGNQGNQVDGKTVFPNVLGPQPRTKTRTLPDPDLREASVVASISLDDQPIVDFDNAISRAYSSAKDLTQKATELLNYATRENDIEALNKAKDIFDLCANVIEPWISELDNRFNQFIGNADELDSVND